MARARTGSLELRKNGYHARITIDLPDGTAERRWVPLETFDKARAKRMKDKLVAELEAGNLVADAKATATAAETFEEAVRAWCTLREARGVQLEELGYFVHHVFVHPDIAQLPVVDVRRVHCKALLDRATLVHGQKTGKPLSHETVSHLRRMLVRFFNALEADEVIAVNPMRMVPMPKMKHDLRQRTPLTDDEYSALLSADVDFTPAKKTGKPRTREIEFFEMKVVGFTARTLGGARAAECLRWDWAMIDRVDFITCTLGRAKTGKFQALEMPEVLRPFLRGWWLAAGKPDHGPVFPVSRGARKGELRGKSGLAARFRRALLRAGVTRHEVHNDTPHSKRTDFHTRRREYVSALASSGTNEQTAMALASHADSKVHKRYQLAQIVAVPVGALPRFSADFSAQLPRLVDDSSGGLSQVLDSRAGEGIRTLDVHLGKVALYH